MPAGRPTTKLPNGEWYYTDGDYAKHGQHYKMYGSCGYVNYHLYSKDIISKHLINLSKRPIAKAKGSGIIKTGDISKLVYEGVSEVFGEEYG